MAFHGLKFECLKFGDNKDLSEEYDYIDSSGSNSIKDAQQVKDLGIYMSDSGKFDFHVDELCKKVQTRILWVCRMFYSRDISFMKRNYITLIHLHIDYYSQV